MLRRLRPLRRWGLGVACGLAIACGIPDGALAQIAPAPDAGSPVERAQGDRLERGQAGRDARARAAERRSRAERRARRRANEQQFRALSLARGGIAVAGVGLWCAGVWLRRRGEPQRLVGLRHGLLAVLAVSAFPAYYNFFGAVHPGGFKGADVYHYYLGSRYFAELGYFDLYPCTLAALVEDGLEDPEDLPPVRDQRTLRLQSREETRAAMAACPDRFEPARWEAFRRDVRFFRPRVLGGSWTHLLEDHGYNPTPVWSFAGGLVSRAVLPTAESLPAVVVVDRVLVVLMGLLVAWAFGLEAACLAAIVWGTSPLWSYNWTGDAFLRNLWIFSAVAGLCLLERGRAFAAGLALSAAGLLRLFPAIFAVGPLLRAVGRLREQGLTTDAKRLVAGLAVGGVLLLAAGAFATGRGPGAYLEFREKMAAVVAQPGVNKIGLSALVSEMVHRAEILEVTTPDGRTLEVADRAPFTVAFVRGVQGLIVLVGVVAYLRACRRASPSEAALLGFALIPLVTSPANYYYVFAVCGALLSATRPWVGVALGAALLGWIAGDQAFFLDEARYLAWDVVAILLSLTVLVGMALGPPSASTRAAPPGAGAPAAPTTA